MRLGDKKSKHAGHPMWDAYRGLRMLNDVSSSKARYDKNGVRIEVKLSFEEFCDIWTASGKWDLRGNKRGCYCLSRIGDIGHYEVGNVFINKFENNSRFGNLNRKDNEEQKANKREAGLRAWAATPQRNVGRKDSDEARIRKSEAAKLAWQTRTAHSYS